MKKNPKPLGRHLIQAALLATLMPLLTMVALGLWQYQEDYARVERFTDRIVALLNEERDGLVFLLWGSHAQKKGQHIDRRRHLVLESAHPSPLSAHRGFLGCGHFSKANAWLRQHGRPEIDWQLPAQAG